MFRGVDQNRRKVTSFMSFWDIYFFSCNPVTFLESCTERCRTALCGYCWNGVELHARWALAGRSARAHALHVMARVEIVGLLDLKIENSEMIIAKYAAMVRRLC